MVNLRFVRHYVLESGLKENNVEEPRGILDSGSAFRSKINIDQKEVNDDNNSSQTVTINPIDLRLPWSELYK